jgi:hypothetical protein
MVADNGIACLDHNFLGLACKFTDVPVKRKLSKANLRISKMVPGLSPKTMQQSCKTGGLLLDWGKG